MELMIAHPFEILPERLQTGLLFAALTACAGVMGYMIYLDLPLRTSAAPQGILSYELARTESRAAAILASWRAHEKPLPAPGARNGIVVSYPRMLYLRAFDQVAADFLFLFSYALALSLASLWAARGGCWPELGVAFAWLAWAAALADGVENTMLLRQIGQGANAEAAQTAFLCALFKFAVCVGALLYIAAATWNTPRRPAGVAASLVVLFFVVTVGQALL